MTRRYPRARVAPWLVLSALPLLVASTPETARADGSNLLLEWTAPPGCPSRGQMEDRIAKLVGDGKRARETIRARAVVAADGTGPIRAVVELAISGEQTSRHVEGDSCAAVSDAVVLIIAIAIDPEAALAAPAAEESDRAPPVAAAPRAAEAPRDAESRPRHSFFVGASARFDVSSLPAPVFGGEVAIGWNSRHVDLELGAALLPPARATLATRPSEGADIRLTDLGARGCYEVLDGPFDVGPCAGLHARWMSAHGFGSDTPHDATALLGVASFGALARARLSSRMTLRVSTDAMLPLSRPSFLIDTGGTVYQAPGAAFRMAFGAELHF